MELMKEEFTGEVDLKHEGGGLVVAVWGGCRLFGLKEFRVEIGQGWSPSRQ